MATTATAIRDGIKAAILAIAPTVPGDADSASPTFHLLRYEDPERQINSGDDRGIVLRFVNGQRVITVTDNVEKDVERQLELRIVYFVPARDEEAVLDVDARMEEDAADIENAITNWKLGGSSPADLGDIEVTESGPLWADGAAAKAYQITFTFFRRAT